MSGSITKDISKPLHEEIGTSQEPAAFPPDFIWRLVDLLPETWKSDILGLESFFTNTYVPPRHAFRPDLLVRIVKQQRVCLWNEIQWTCKNNNTFLIVYRLFETQLVLECSTTACDIPVSLWSVDIQKNRGANLRANRSFCFFP